jgi:hypothetical protein
MHAMLFELEVLGKKTCSAETNVLLGQVEQKDKNIQQAGFPDGHPL